MTIIGAIIAGGQSSRMGGREKAFLELDSKPVILHVIEQFEPQVDQLVINANGEPARFSEFGLEVVPDVLTSFDDAACGYCMQHFNLRKDVGGDVLVTVPSDTPFLPFDLAAKLLENTMASGAAIAASGGQEHYIIGAWKTELLDDLDRAIAKDGLFRVKDWAHRVSAQKVEWPVEPHDPFFNVNTPEDLLRAQQILEGFPMKQKIIGVAGFKNAGKTTLVEKLVVDLTARGFRISTVKHAHHSFDIDHEGRDSFRHRKAGATEVAVVSSGRWALIHELRNEAEPNLEDILTEAGTLRSRHR